jgi:hypothetical protein
MDDIAWTTEPEAARLLIQNILDTTRILSPTGMEQEMTEFCNAELIRCGFETEVTPEGSIMAIRGRGSQEKFVLLNAHMDTVDINKPRTETSLRKEYKLKRDEILTRLYMMKCGFVSSGKARIKSMSPYDRTGDIAFVSKEAHDEFDSLVKMYETELEDYSKFIFDNSGNQTVYETSIANPWQPERIAYNPALGAIAIARGGGVMYMGGDDKAGVSMILTIARLSNLPFKVLFTVSEERESVRPHPDNPKDSQSFQGIELIPPEFYDDVAFDLTLDKGEENLIVDSINGYKLHTKEFSEYIMGIAKRFDYPLKQSYGSRCDALHIHQYVPAANISTGYRGAHTAYDHVDVIAAHNMMTIVKHVIEDYNETHPVFEVVSNQNQRKKGDAGVLPQDISRELFSEITGRVHGGFTYLEDGKRILDLIPRSFYNLRNDLIAMENRIRFNKERLERGLEKENKKGKKGKKSRKMENYEKQRNIDYYVDLGYPHEDAVEFANADERARWDRADEFSS